MSFRIPWNEAVPPGSDPADTIDDGIRSLKISIGERLDDLLDWRDDDIDPKSFTGWQVALDTRNAVVEGVTETVEWNTPFRDTTGFITVPAKNVCVPVGEAGLYMMGITVGWLLADPGTGRATLTLRRNGQVVRRSLQSDPSTSVSRILTVIRLRDENELRVEVRYDIPVAPSGPTFFAEDGIQTTKWWGLRLGAF